MLAEEHLGSRLKTFRTERNLTLEELSHASGVSISTLSKIENSQVSPSYGTLKKIADGLNVSFERLIKDKKGMSDLARRVVTRAADILKVRSDRYSLEMFAVDLVPKAMVPIVMSVKARKPPAPADLHVHEGEEFIFVLSGQVEIYLEHYNSTLLKEGEGLYIDSRMKHGFTNVGKGVARLLSVYYDPNELMQRPKDFVKLLRRENGLQSAGRK